MNQPSRRDFLKRTLLSGAALGGVARPPLAQGQASEQSVDMSIMRWKLPPEPDSQEIAHMAIRLTEGAILALGGMNRFVSRGDVVWVKPNIGFDRPPETAANTNPDVVATLVRLCYEAGAGKVRVGDNSCYGATGAYPTSGIEAAANAAGAEVVYLDPNRFKMMDVNGHRIKKWLVSEEIVESDLVINVPVAKVHGMTAVSVCLKNYMGVIGGPRQEWHTDMPTCLTDIAAFMKPRLSVVDAMRTIVKHGPIGFSLDDTELRGIVAAGVDVVALEAFGAELLGCVPQQGKTMNEAQARGLGRIDYRHLVLREQEIA
ncbi:MAG TPA: DUF362 domain-containing protein [Candidatus Hydrogenedentes bacterium]|nr:DUF362 domain-containing protein [Candidatus Hydrogenedentota bacterium]HPG68821.1 DUF362 domain-containing protein [Candidatus Hydrogenedentota bacterium]